MFGAIAGLVGKKALGGLGGLLGGGKKKQADPEKQQAKQMAKELQGLPPEQRQQKLQELAQQNPSLAAKVEKQLEKLDAKAAQSATGGGAPQVAGLDPSAIVQAAKNIVPQLGLG